MPVKPVPKGYHTATPYLVVDGAAAAIKFYKKAYQAKELMRFDMGGKIGHAELQVGDSRIMLADEHPEMGYRGPQAYGGTSVGIVLYVPDADAVFKKAVAAGAKVVRPLQDQFYGDRAGTVTDPFGHQWTIMTHVEDVSPKEMKKRMKEFQKTQGGA